MGGCAVKIDDASLNVSPTAERMRRHRQRQHDGLRCLTIEVYDKEVDALIQKGLLKPETRNDPFSVIEALYKHLRQTLVLRRDA
jgi:hypothetical protein